MKIKNFLSRNKEFFITSAIIMALVISLYIVNGIFPFGINSIMHYDMAAQTVPLSELIYGFFSGDSQLFYTTMTGLGANTFGYLIYFILSPFNLLTLLGGKGNTLYAVNIVLILKLIVIGCVITWFIKHYFKNLKPITIISLSLMYVFSGYMLFNWTYMSFLDNLIYAPLFIYCFDLLKNKNKIMPLSIIIFLMILSCFSLGCFTLLYLMILFIIYIFTNVEKEARKDLIIKVISSCLIGIGLSLWLLVPALKQYMSSSRGNTESLFETELFTGTSTKIGVIITECVSFIFAVIYIIKCDKKDKFNQFLCWTALLTIFTAICDEMMLVLNGGSIFGYFSRFGFVGALLTLTLACKYFLSLSLDENTNVFNTSISYLLTGVLVFSYSICILSTLDTFSNAFSSQSILSSSLIIYIVGLCILCLPLLYSIFVRKNIGKHFHIVTLIITICLCFTNIFLHFYNTPFDTRPLNSTLKLTKYIEKDARVKMCQTTYVNRNTITLGLSSIDTFSSMVDGTVTNSLRKLGYNSSSNSVTSYGGTLLSDILVGNKYILTEYPINNDYIKFIAKEDIYYLYENTLYQKYLQIFNTDIQLSDNIVENQNNLYRALGGTENLLEKLEIDNSKSTLDNCYYDKQTNKYIAIYDEELSTINFNFNYPKNVLIYCKYSNNNLDDYVFVNSYNAPTGLTELPESSMEDHITFHKSINMEDFEFYTLDTNKLNNLLISSSDIKINKGKISGSVNLETDSTVILPFMNIDGYTVKVNGEESKFSNKFLDFMTIDLSTGENNIEIQFNNPLYKWILIGLIGGILLVSVGLLIYKLINKFSDKFINIAFSGFSIIYLFIFVLFPFTIFVMKLINVI